MNSIEDMSLSELDLVAGGWSAGEIGGAIVGSGAAYSLGVSGAELGALGGPIGAMIGAGLGVAFGMGIDYIGNGYAGGGQLKPIIAGGGGKIYQI